jgi:hypothetical protein
MRTPTWNTRLNDDEQLITEKTPTQNGQPFSITRERQSLMNSHRQSQPFSGPCLFDRESRERISEIGSRAGSCTAMELLVRCSRRLAF